MIFFQIPEPEKKEFIGMLKKFYVRDNGDIDGVNEQAEITYDNLVNGLTIKGKQWRYGSVFFDLRLAQATRGFYQPKEENKRRFKGQPTTIPRESAFLENNGKSSNKVEFTRDLLKFPDLEAKQKYEKEVKALLREYPNLNRVDIKTDVELYVRMNVTLDRLVSGNIGNETAIKNLIQAKMQLAEFLCISEKQKQEEKLASLKDNIASLALKFELTLKEMPELYTDLKKKELKMLLQKYERGELSRTLFEGDCFAGCSIEEAYDFVKNN